MCRPTSTLANRPCSRYRCRASSRPRGAVPAQPSAEQTDTVGSSKTSLPPSQPMRVPCGTHTRPFGFCRHPHRSGDSGTAPRRSATCAPPPREPRLDVRRCPQMSDFESPARRPAERLVEIWNSNSRDKAVTRYTSRTAGVARLWKASQLLEGGMEPSDPEGPRPAKPAKRTQPAMKAKAAKKAAPTKKARDKRSARS